MTADIPTESDSSWRASAIVCVILLAGIACVYFAASSFGFIDYDDLNMVGQNHLLNPPTIQSLAEIWQRPILELYAPLSYSLWWMLARLDLGSPQSLHVVNICLHGLAAIFTWSILNYCLKQKWPALLGAAFWALHPLQVQSVAWIAEMNNLLAAVFLLAAIRVYLPFADAKRRRALRYIIATILFILALLAKPTSIIAPVIAITLEAGMLGRGIIAPLMRALPWLYLDLPIAWITHETQRGWITPLSHRPAVAADAIGFYLWKLYWPTPILIDYARTPHVVWEHQLWILTGITAGIFLVVHLILIKPAPPLAAGAAIFLLALVPVIGLMPFSLQRWSTVADHFVYVALLGPALAIGWVAKWPWRLGWVIRSGLLVGIIFLGFLSASQVQTWHDSQSLAKHTLDVDPASTVANRIAAEDFVKSARYSDAIPHFQRALLRDPTSGELHYDLANALLRNGQPEDAIAEYQAALPLLDTDHQALAAHFLQVARDEAGVK